MRSLLQTAILFAIAISPATTGSIAHAQSEQLDEMDFINEVSELQDQLDAEQLSDREAAETALIKMGPLVLEHLDDPADDMPLDKVERLARIRKELETIAVRAASEASVVSLSGPISVEESLKRIAQQTGNDVALVGETPIDTGSKMIVWKGDKVSFWEAIEHIQSNARLTIDPYAANGSSLRLAPADARTKEFLKKRPPVQATANMFHVQVTRVDAARNLAHPNLDHLSLQLLIRWEPRLRPISLKLFGKDMKTFSPDGNPLQILKEESVFAGMVQPQIPQLELSIPLKPIARNIDQIKSFKANIVAVLPGRTETFRFRRVGKLPPGKKIERAGATVTMEGIDRNEDLYGITVSLEFDEELNALESHQSWVFDNPVYLEDDGGRKSPPLTFETIRQDNNRVAIIYYFADDPGEQTLVYQTSAAILQTDAQFELKNIPLP